MKQQVIINGFRFDAYTDDWLPKPTYNFIEPYVKKKYEEMKKFEVK